MRCALQAHLLPLRGAFLWAFLVWNAKQKLGAAATDVNQCVRPRIKRDLSRVIWGYPEGITESYAYACILTPRMCPQPWRDEIAYLIKYIFIYHQAKPSPPLSFIFFCSGHSDVCEYFYKKLCAYHLGELVYHIKSYQHSPGIIICIISCNSSCFWKRVP